jgi:hypothetical protein
MDPFTLALATFGVQKLRGKSTKRALRDAALIGGGSYALGASGALGSQSTFGQGPMFSGLGLGPKTYGEAEGLKSITRSELYGKQFMDPKRVAQIAESSPLSEAVVGGESATKTGIAKLLEKAKKNPLETALLTSSVLPLLGGEDEEFKPPFTEEDYKQAYKEQAGKLEGAFEPVTNAMPTRAETYGSNMFYANEGGLATAIPKYNEGGINYLPSKIDHNENDVNNYVRAEGYVEDGAGAGNKDEDTMLAQLADGEFVSRADAVLGAGILSGGDPKSFKSMRKAGADFFYDQQKKFKRIYDIVNASKPN